MPPLFHPRRAPVTKTAQVATGDIAAEDLVYVIAALSLFISVAINRSRKHLP
jgi:hypothetical protein